MPEAGTVAPARGPQRRGERTRRRLLEAALRLIARQGVGAMSFRELAREAGVSLGVTTYHFPNRQALLAAAIELHLERTDAEGDALTATLEGAGPGRPASLEHATEAIVAMLWRMVHDERDRFLASQELTLELARDPSLAAHARDAFDQHRAAVMELVRRAGSTEPELDAEILSATFQGLALKWLREPDAQRFARRLRPVVRRIVSRFQETRT